MHQFTDEDISDANLDAYGDVCLTLASGSYIYLSKKDLLHLLKLIEETN